MGKKILDSRILYLALSIVIAVSLWFYVTVTDEEPRTQTIHNIPVVFTGEEFLEDRSLMIVGEYTVSVTVRTTPMVLSALKSDTMQVTVNVSSITQEGTHTLAYSVGYPASVRQSDVEIISGINGNVVSVEIARYTRREGIPIVGEFTGSAAEGYLPGGPDDFLFSPGTLTVSGRQELVNQVDHARVVIDEMDLTETVNGEYPFELIDPSGNSLDIDVTCDVEMIYVSFPIQATAEIPLTVSFISGGGVDASEASSELSTPSITVAGSREAVDALVAAGAINLATIDLSAAYDGEERTFPVPLTDELTNISGVTEVKAVISLNKDLVTRTLGATRISYINPPPEGWMVDIVTQALTVELRGREELFVGLTEESLRVTADLSEITTLAVGQYSVRVTVDLDWPYPSSELGIMSADYRIVVNLYEGYPEPEAEPDAEIAD